MSMVGIFFYRQLMELARKTAREDDDGYPDEEEYRDE